MGVYAKKGGVAGRKIDPLWHACPRMKPLTSNVNASSVVFVFT
uniref:Uncharacterized protein n=1 Tax=Anguilla anguilla TaxID=7936 RepID=A0A0E9QE46_ANGAN